MRWLSTGVVIAVATIEPVSVAAQSTDADAVVRRLQEAGSIIPVGPELVFEACPQADDDGRAVFAAVTRAELSPTVLAETARLWTRQYVECGYAPLETWYENAYATILQSDDRYAIFWIVDAAPVDLTGRMREALWQAVAQLEGGELSDMLASNAVDSSHPRDRLAMTVAAIRDRPVSGNFVFVEGGRLLREDAAGYVRAVTQAAPSMSDERLTTVLASIDGNLRGRVIGDSRDLEALREAVANRQGIRPELRALEPPK